MPPPAHLEYSYLLAVGMTQVVELVRQGVYSWTHFDYVERRLRLPLHGLALRPAAFKGFSFCLLRFRLPASERCGDMPSPSPFAARSPPCAGRRPVPPPPRALLLGVGAAAARTAPLFISIFLRLSAFLLRVVQMSTFSGLFSPGAPHRSVTQGARLFVTRRHNPSAVRGVDIDPSIACSLHRSAYADSNL